MNRRGTGCSIKHGNSVTNKQTKKIIQSNHLGYQIDIRETNSDYEMEKGNLKIFTLKKMV